MVDRRERLGTRHPGLIGQSRSAVIAISLRLWLWERATHALAKGLALAIVLLLIGVVGFQLLNMVYYAPGSANLNPDSTYSPL
jgi:hypothetical protein